MDTLAVTCLRSSEILLVDPDEGVVTRRMRFEGVNDYDVVHSIRSIPDGWLVSSTYAVHHVDRELRRVVASWTHPRLSNVHAVDVIKDERVVITNTGCDELVIASLKGDLVVEEIWDGSSWAGVPRRLEVRDRRGEPRVSASQDNLHLNCAHVEHGNGGRLWCCLFHPGDIVVITLDGLEVVNRFLGVGEMVHSSIPHDGVVWVCSSREGLIKAYDRTTKRCVRTVVAPLPGWTRSGWTREGQLYFAVEADRDPKVRSADYVCCYDLARDEVVWSLPLDGCAPFDVIARESSDADAG